MNVLFVCVANSGRSVMAERLFRQAVDGRHAARSAGSAPGAAAHPQVLDALRELGIDASDHVPHTLDEEAIEWADVVVATCDDACPVDPGKRYVNWHLPDPKHEPLERVREIRDEIDRRVRALAAQLDTADDRSAALMALVEQRPRLAAEAPADDAAVLKRLSTLDRFLPLWIGLAMAVGLGLGRLIPSLNDGLDTLQVGTVSLPIALGLLLMMYPVLAKVRYEELDHTQRDGVSNRVFFGWSLFLSWVVGPLLMFALAWLFLADQPAYRTGVIIVGLARCIAMVLIWNDLAQGDRDRTALLVVFNALFQVAAYSLLGYFYLTVLPGWLGLDAQGFEVGIWEVAKTVLIFLGIPLAAGFLTRRIGLKRKGREWYDTRFLPKIGPITLYGLLFTIVLLFAIQGEKITAEPADVARIALPLLSYFLIMWIAGFTIGKAIGLPYAQTASMGFTVASNDFELAIAVAVGVFGATSGEALAGVVGPLIEVPVLVTLVYVALWARRYWRSSTPTTAPAAT